jgi:hypothetical protein
MTVGFSLKADLHFSLSLENGLFNPALRLQVKRVSYFILSTALVHIRSVTLWIKPQQQQYPRTDNRRSQNDRISYLSDAGETGLREKTLGKLSYPFPLVKN